MAYVLYGIVGDFDRLRALSCDLPGAVVAPLRQRLGLLPTTAEIFSELTGVRRENGPFIRMSPAFAERLADWSRSGRIAYMEAEFWAGDGTQAAALWENGRQTWGPEHSWLPEELPRRRRPINAVLARLGAVLGQDSLDLFQEVGFGEERDMEGWRSAGLRALDAADYDAWEADRRALAEAHARAAATERAKNARRAGLPVVLDGRAVMDVLDIPPSPMVGAALRHLQEIHLERGSLTPDEAATELRRWAQNR
jgi:hypothetical protein